MAASRSDCPALFPSYLRASKRTGLFCSILSVLMTRQWWLDVVSRTQSVQQPFQWALSLWSALREWKQPGRPLFSPKSWGLWLRCGMISKEGWACLIMFFSLFWRVKSYLPFPHPHESDSVHHKLIVLNWQFKRGTFPSLCWRLN